MFPLAHRVPLRTDDGAALVFHLGGRRVAIEGDPDAALRILGLCDGSRSPDEIAEHADIPPADVTALLGALAQAGAVVDARESWRVFHDWTSTHSAMIHPLDPADLEAARPDRGEPEPELALDTAPTRTAELAAGRRSSSPDGRARLPDFLELSAMLAAAYGRNDEGRRTVPSGGALEPLVVHVVSQGAPSPLTAGAWRLARSGGGLHRAAPAGEDAALTSLFISDPVADGLLAAGGPVVFISAELARTARKYQGRAYRLALLEAGAAMQNAYLVAAELGVPIRAVSGFHERLAAATLGLDDGTLPLIALVLGS